VDLTRKNGKLTSKNCDFTSKTWDLTRKSWDITRKNIDFTNKQRWGNSSTKLWESINNFLVGFDWLMYPTRRVNQSTANVGLAKKTGDLPNKLHLLMYGNIVWNWEFWFPCGGSTRKNCNLIKTTRVASEWLGP
jgi:hypothetical protein